MKGGSEGSPLSICIGDEDDDDDDDDDEEVGSRVGSASARGSLWVRGSTNQQHEI